MLVMGPANIYECTALHTVAYIAISHRIKSSVTAQNTGWLLQPLPLGCDISTAGIVKPTPEVGRHDHDTPFHPTPHGNDATHVVVRDIFNDAVGYSRWAMADEHPNARGFDCSRLKIALQRSAHTCTQHTRAHVRMPARTHARTDTVNTHAPLLQSWNQQRACSEIIPGILTLSTADGRHAPVLEGLGLHACSAAGMSHQHSIIWVVSKTTLGQ